MRNIKFKAPVYTSNPMSDDPRAEFACWVTFNLQSFDVEPNTGVLFIRDCDNDGLEYQDYLVDLRKARQWTGLVDCKGVKIYEGDIVGRHHRSGPLQHAKVVEWTTGMNYCGWNISRGKQETIAWKVIGYENAEVEA